jgi:alanine dehydrogenase
MKTQTLILIIMICQRELVEILSASIFKFEASKIPNPLTANVAFAAMNYPSLAIYMAAYIISIKEIINGPKRIKKNSDSSGNTETSQSLR